MSVACWMAMVGSRRAELVKDGDLVLLIGSIFDMHGRDTVRIF